MMIEANGEGGQREDGTLSTSDSFPLSSSCLWARTYSHTLTLAAVASLLVVISLLDMFSLWVSVPNNIEGHAKKKKKKKITYTPTHKTPRKHESEGGHTHTHLAHELILFSGAVQDAIK